MAQHPAFPDPSESDHINIMIFDFHSIIHISPALFTELQGGLAGWTPTSCLRSVNSTQYYGFW